VQLVQTIGCRVPHLGQKAKPLWTSKPQLPQFIDSRPAKRRTGATAVEPD
jgi:hypothetical protein